MVNANELRIGNWVQTNHNGKNKQGTIIEITNHHIHLIAVNKVGGVLDLMEYLIEPIPLTPEILEKCGFEATKNEYWRIKDNGDLDFGIDINVEGKTYIHAITNSTGSKVPLIIQSLHQLQNLYFALTGEELNVQL